MATGRSSGEFLRRHEGVLALLFALVLFVANVITAPVCPAFSSDEILLGDAGVNLALGHGFTSTGWRGQSDQELFAGNLPLYPLALAGWIKAFGFGLRQIRSFSMFCGSLAALVLWWSVQRLEWLRTPAARLALLPLLFLARPVLGDIRFARYDALQMLICAGYLAVLAARLRPAWERAALAVLGFLLALAGFQAAAYAGLLCLLALARDWRRFLGPALAIGLGQASGGAAFLLWAKMNGVLHGFTDAIAYAHGLDGGPLAQGRLVRVFAETFLDEALVLLVAAAVLAVAPRGIRASQPALGRLVRWLVAAVVVISVGMEATVHFASYYRWMTLFPAGIIALVVVEGAWPALAQSRRRLVMAALLALLIGSPLRYFAWGVISGDEPQLAELERLAARELRPADIVLADYPAYCVIKTRVAKVYTPGYIERMTPAEKSSLTALIGVPQRDNRFGDFGAYFSTPERPWQIVARVPPYRAGLIGLFARYFPAKLEHHERSGSHYAQAIYRLESPPAR